MKKKGFTLIELLAVIIILGILMLVAIPSVTSYINNSRKQSYVSTIKELIKAASNKTNSGDLDMFDTDTTYYIPVSALELENGKATSPYGKIDEAYVVVTYDGEEYNYYYVGKDDTDMGLNELTEESYINIDLITNVEDVDTTVGIYGKKYISILDDDLEIKTTSEAEKETTGVVKKKCVDGECICKRATVLHTAECTRSQGGCFDLVGNGTITYGNLGVKGDNLVSGDALDCDVNNDGNYDPETERFYYVTSYGDNYVLIYYSNVNNQTLYAYDSSGENWHGPVTGYQYLPRPNEWSNHKIIYPGVRDIVTEYGNDKTCYNYKYCNDSNEIDTFDYGDSVARFLTAKDIKKACNTYPEATVSTGSLDGCTYLLENIWKFENNSNYSLIGGEGNGYWLETPNEKSKMQVLVVEGYYRDVYNGAADYSKHYSVRPVIEVSKFDISY